MNYADIVKRLVEDTNAGLINWKEGQGYWQVKIGDCYFTVFLRDNVLTVTKGDDPLFSFEVQCVELIPILKEKYVSPILSEEERVSHVFECLNSYEYN